MRRRSIYRLKPSDRNATISQLQRGKTRRALIRSGLLGGPILMVVGYLILNPFVFYAGASWWFVFLLVDYKGGGRP